MDRRPEQTFLQRRHTGGQHTWKDAQHHWSIGKCKSKPQWDITSHLSEWRLPKRQKITNVGEDVVKREPPCAVDRNINWCSHYGKKYKDSSKN